MDATEGHAVVQAEWAYVIGLLPADLEESARAYGALRRRRHITSAAALLRLALGYAMCDWSLPIAAASAEMLGLGKLSHVAVLKRLRGCAPWLGRLTGQWLQERGLVRDLPSTPLRLVDASTVSAPGSKGTDWRLHASYDAGTGCFDRLELTDAKGGESLDRFSARPGDVLLADRGYAHTASLVKVMAAGGMFVVRFPWSTLPLRDVNGDAWDLLAFLKKIPDAAAAGHKVRLTTPDAPVVRVVGVRKSPEATAAAQRKAKEVARSKGKTVNPLTLEYAAYIFVATNVPETIASDVQVLEIYRLRWQIELAFKRLKGVLQFDALRAKDRELARTYLLGKLLGALIVDELTVRAQLFSPWGFTLR